MNMKVKCPTCGKSIIWNNDNEWRPFCSQRCRTIDLGAWADEQYRVAGEPVMDESLETLDQNNELN
jgi:endogenous inhibitor of DNA gyrase (YacG/DUF329 family)